jgi:hypothetical protein
MPKRIVFALRPRRLRMGTDTSLTLVEVSRLYQCALAGDGADAAPARSAADEPTREHQRLVVGSLSQAWDRRSDFSWRGAWTQPLRRRRGREVTKEMKKRILAILFAGLIALAAVGNVSADAPPGPPPPCQGQGHPGCSGPGGS